MYDYCEEESLQYAFGYSSNARLKRMVSEEELEENARWLWWKAGQQPFQLFHSFEDYAADSWPHARRIITKVEITKTAGSNIRYVVTNMTGHSRDIYHGFYTQRGNVPERPIGELKNGLNMDRLSSHRFLANAHKLQVHVLAYLLYALFREANAEVPELSKMEVGTARTQLFKAGAKVKATHRRIWFKIASHWPGAKLLSQAVEAVTCYVSMLHQRWSQQNLYVKSLFIDAKNRPRIQFAPLPLN